MLIALKIKPPRRHERQEQKAKEKKKEKEGIRR
jgi:hypothetical protein